MVERTGVSAAKKGAIKEGRTLVFLDEAAIYLLPAVVRTYAPVGVTPILEAPLSKEHLSAISAVTPAGALYMMVHEGAIHSVDVVRFVGHVQRQIGGKLLFFWDGAPIHRGKPVQVYLSSAAAASIQVVVLPGYAPELNPDEGVWQHLKNEELANVCCHDIPELTDEFHRAVNRLRRKPEVIRSFFAQAGL